MWVAADPGFAKGYRLTVDTFYIGLVASVTTVALAHTLSLSILYIRTCLHKCVNVPVLGTCKVCREEKAGREYIGKVNTTVSGKQCQQWSSNAPHVRNSNFTDTDFPNGSLAAAENFCRNPDSSYSEGVWCYTTDPTVPREACEVPECGKSDAATR